MRSEWGRGDGRNGRSGGGSGAGAGRGNGNFAAQSPRESRWSDELDSIFERAPKETVAPQNPAKDDEKNFFEERTEVKAHALTCPHCSSSGDYALTWLVRRKREHPAGYADEATLARFEKARSYMVRREDQVACSNVRCRKRFEVVGVQSVAFMQEAAEGSVDLRAARIRAAFAGRSRE